jgi:uncharacterized protein (DUF1015 family)
VPTLRPFRALRYDAERVTDVGAVLCPPYDVITPEERDALAARHPYNAVRLELPPAAPGAPADDRYRQAARDLVAWRSDGILRKDQQASIYVHEMAFETEGTPHTARGVLARLRLEPFSPDGGVRPHERTMSGPKEDRLRLLTATGANLSPVVLLYDSEHAAAALLDALTEADPTVEATDADGVAHRLWVVPVTSDDGVGRELLRTAEARPLTIADGHHRYETALAYRETRGRNRACESDPPYDYVLALLYDVTDRPPAVLPTHRVVRGADPAALLAAAADEFDLQEVASTEALDAPPDGSATEERWGSGRFRLWWRGGGAILRARSGRPGVVDVSRLASVLERAYGVDAAALAAGGRIIYTKDAHEAVALVTAGEGDIAVLLDPTPLTAVLETAASGGVMPQKSTYFAPKAPTGLLFNPLEP